MNPQETEYDKLRNTPGTPEYKQRTEYLRAAGFTSEANARDKHQETELRLGTPVISSEDAQRLIAMERPQGNITANRVVFESFGEDTVREHIRLLRQQIEALQPSREKAKSLTKLDECEMWLARAPR